MCSCVGLSGWSTNSSVAKPGGGVSRVDVCTDNGIDERLVTSCGVFGALPDSDVSSYNTK